jgi:hypothetical protein
MIGGMGIRTATASGLACLLLVSACTVPVPADNPTSSVGDSPAESASADPAGVLTGRAVEALDGGRDVVLRIGVPGYRLPEGERMYDLHGDRVLSTRADPEGGNAWMIVRDLDGRQLHEFDTGMTVPQTGIIRGDAVYFGGIDIAEDPLGSDDRGAWVVRGTGQPELILPPVAGPAIYNAFETSPDGRTVGITRSAELGATTYLLRDGTTREVPKQLLLITMTNDVTVLIGAFSDITAFAIADVAELWHAETGGLYGARYPSSDGTRIVNSVIEDAGEGDGNTQDQLRIEMLDALTGVAEQTVLIPAEQGPTPWVAPTLSSDRYVALLDTVLPSLVEGPGSVRVVDLEAGELLDLELTFGAVP